MRSYKMFIASKRFSSLREVIPKLTMLFNSIDARERKAEDAFLSSENLLSNNFFRSLFLYLAIL